MGLILIVYIIIVVLRISDNSYTVLASEEIRKGLHDGNIEYFNVTQQQL